MKITYEFINGETVEIEVGDKWGRLIIDMDKDEEKNDRKETRRHERLDASMESDWITDKGTSIQEKLEEKESFERIVKKLREVLTDKQLDAFVSICLEGYGETEYAKARGVRQQTVHYLIVTAKKKLARAFRSI